MEWAGAPTLILESLTETSEPGEAVSGAREEAAWSTESTCRGKRNDPQGAAGFRYTNGENEYTTEAHGKRHHFVVEALPASLWDPILVV